MVCSIHSHYLGKIKRGAFYMISLWCRCGWWIAKRDIVPEESLVQCPYLEGPSPDTKLNIPILNVSGELLKVLSLFRTMIYVVLISDKDKCQWFPTPTRLVDCIIVSNDSSAVFSGLHSNCLTLQVVWHKSTVRKASKHDYQNIIQIMHTYVYCNFDGCVHTSILDGE